MPHVQQLQLTTFFADVAAALAYLHTGEDAHQSTFTLGFCMGGSFSLMTGIQDFDLAGIIAFYSGLSRKFAGANATVLERANTINYPFFASNAAPTQASPFNTVHPPTRGYTKPAA